MSRFDFLLEDKPQPKKIPAISTATKAATNAASRFDHLLDQEPAIEPQVQATSFPELKGTWYEEMLKAAEDSAMGVQPQQISQDVVQPIQLAPVDTVVPGDEKVNKTSIADIATALYGATVEPMFPMLSIAKEFLPIPEEQKPLYKKEIPSYIPEEDRPYVDQRTNQQIVEDTIVENAPKYTGAWAKLGDFFGRTSSVPLGAIRSTSKSLKKGELDAEDFLAALESVQTKNVLDMIINGTPRSQKVADLTGPNVAEKDLGIDPKSVAFNWTKGLTPSAMIGGVGKAISPIEPSSPLQTATNYLLQGLVENAPKIEAYKSKGMLGVGEEIVKDVSNFYEPVPVKTKDLVGFGLEVATDPFNAVTAGVAPTAVKFAGKYLNPRGVKYLKSLVPVEVEALTKSLGEAQLDELVQAESKLAGVQLSKDQALLRSAVRKVERNFAQAMAHPDPNLDRFIDKGGIKLFGRSVMTGEEISQAIKQTPIVGDISKWFGQSKTAAYLKSYMNRDALLEYRNSRAQKIFQDTGIDVLPKTKEILQEFYNAVGSSTDDVVDEMAKAFTIRRTVNGVTSEFFIGDAERKLIHNVLENAQEESGNMLADYLLAKELGDKTAKEVLARGSEIIKELKANTKALAQLEFEKILTSMEGVGIGAVEALKEAGITTIDQVAALDPKELLKILNKKLPTLPKRIGEATAHSMILQANDLLKGANAATESLRKIVGIGEKRRLFLENAGITTVEDIVKLTPEQIIDAMDKSATGLGIMSLKKNKAFAESVIGKAKEAVVQIGSEAPILQAKRLELQQQLDEITALLDLPETDIQTIKQLTEKVKQYKKTLKQLVGVKRSEFDAVAMKHIKTLPKELQKPAYETWRALRKAEKTDTKSKLLTKLIPNYVPRKYEGLFEIGVSSSGMIKKSVSRFKRKLLSTADAKAFAVKNGGELVEDIVIPTAERLIKGRKANALKKMEDKLATLYQLKKGEKLDDVIDGYSAWKEQAMNFKQSTNPLSIAAINTFDKGLNLYKGMLTSMFPSFHARNMMSNKFLSFLGTGSDVLNPIMINHGLNIKAGVDGYITDVFGIRHNYDEIRKLAKENRVTKGFYTGDVVESLQDAIEGQKSLDPRKMGMKVGQHIEELDRMTLFASYIKKGMTPEQAAEQVRKFLFDYQDLSQFEQSVMKRVFPFYTYKRKSVELFAEQILKQPRVFTNVFRLADMMSEYDIAPEDLAKMPTWMQNKIMITTPGGVVTGVDLGFEDFANVMSALTLDQNALRAQASQMNPLLVSMVEYLTEKQLFNDKSIDKAAQVLDDIPEFILQSPIGKELGAKIKYEPIYDMDGNVAGKKKVWFSSDPYKIWLLRKMPTSRLMGQVQDIESGDSDWFKMLTGISEKPLDENLVDYFERMKLQKALEVEGLGKNRQQFFLNKQEKQGINTQSLEKIMGKDKKAKYKGNLKIKKI